MLSLLAMFPFSTVLATLLVFATTLALLMIALALPLLPTTTTTTNVPHLFSTLKSYTRVLMSDSCLVIPVEALQKLVEEQKPHSTERKIVTGFLIMLLISFLLFLIL